MGLSKAVKSLALFCAFLSCLLGGSPSALAFAISTSSPESTRAAHRILAAGGNAADAVVAAAFALGVSRPQMTGLGGGGIALLWSKARGPYVFEHREEAPRWVPPELLLGEGGEPLPYWPTRVTGPRWVGVPGFVRGYGDIHASFGTLPWENVLDPAKELAKGGVLMTSHMARDLATHWPRMRSYPATAQVFGKGPEGDGRGPLEPGDTLVQKEMASTLEALAKGGASSFYVGPLAEAWLQGAHGLGVQMSPEEVASYTARKPESVAFELEALGLTGFTAPPPSASGFTVAAALRFLAKKGPKTRGPRPLSIDRIVTTVETMAFFQHMCQMKVGDLCTQDSVTSFFGSPEEERAWATIETHIAQRLQGRGPIYRRTDLAQDRLQTESLESHTAHIVVVDDNGLVASATSSIEQFFGAGLVVPGGGFLLNNQLSDFNPQPGGMNSPQPGARPRSNMSPMILVKTQPGTGAQEPVAAVGCAGGPRIPSAVLQFLENHLLFGLAPQEASRLPRFHLQTDGSLLVEKGVGQRVVDGLRSLGYHVEAIDRLPTILQAAVRLEEGWVATTDPRYDGLALWGASVSSPRGVAQVH